MIAMMGSLREIAIREDVSSPQAEQLISSPALDDNPLREWVQLFVVGLDAELIDARHSP